MSLKPYLISRKCPAIQGDVQGHRGLFQTSGDLAVLFGDETSAIGRPDRFRPRQVRLLRALCDGVLQARPSKCALRGRGVKHVSDRLHRERRFRLFLFRPLAMAGLGAAFIFVPLFYYLGVPLAEAVPTALLLNVVSLIFATVNYYRGGLINWRIGLPILITAVLLAPLGAQTTPFVDRRLFLGLFAGFLVFAGFMMLFYKPKPRTKR